MPKHIHIHFAPRKTRDQAPGSVPAAPSKSEIAQLVEALFQAIADRQGAAPAPTRDTEWDESKHPRAEGGRFSTSQHTAAATNHEQTAARHQASAKSNPATAAAHEQAAKLHQAAAEAHTEAIGHLAAKTGLGESKADRAHKASYAAAQASMSMSKGSDVQSLQKIASDPSQPMAKRAAAVQQLEKYEEAAAMVAKSPHALPKPGPDGQPMGTHPAMAQAAQAMGANPSTAPQHTPGSMVPAPVGPKPTSASGPAKAATHALLSSGHPFSVDELMKATGVTNKATIMTALSDLKNPKYAGALGALQIEKQADGMYRVTKAPAGGFKQAASSPNAAPAGASTGAGTPAAPSSGDTPADPHAVVNGSHPLSDYLPGDSLKAGGQSGKTYKVLGHNAEGKVVVQRDGDGAKHAMDPKDLARMSTKQAKAAAPASPFGPSKGGPGGSDYPEAPSPNAKSPFGPDKSEPKPAGPVPAAAQRLAARGPIQQENRNLQAKQLKESRQMVKTTPPGAPSSVRGMQAKADVSGYGPGNLDGTVQRGQEGMRTPREAPTQAPGAAASAVLKARQLAKGGAPAPKGNLDNVPQSQPGLKANETAPGSSDKKAGVVEALRDAGKLPPKKDLGTSPPGKKSIWGTPKPTLKPKDLVVRSGQNTDPKMAVKSGAGPSAPGKKTLESVNHHQSMAKFHREEADRVRGRPGAGSHKDHLRAAQMHENAANEYRQGKAKGGWDLVSAGNANALSKSLGFTGPGVTVPKDAPGKA